MSNFMAASNQNQNPNKSFEVTHLPNDSISSLSFSPKTNILVATSWDNQVLCSAWKDDGSTVFSGGCDKQVKMWPLAGNQPVTVAMHDAPIKEVAWIPEMNYLVTGSLDKNLKYWDLRQQTPIHTQALPERCYTLSVRYPLMVVGTADRNLIVFNLQNPQTEFKRIVSPLKYQTRCVAAFPDQQGFLIEVKEREILELILCSSFQAMARCSQPIPCSAFNSDGSIFAYAVCYDWSKGAENHNPATAKNCIYLHVPQEADVKGKPRINTGKR
ncbi:hypothetical protein DVH24_016482 [Malus domestica]|uniref:Uncharacterized protein n=1 Tax=Malus domestica TaxID=3750 RepID=A0A498HSE2_MALDO|nr:hypothetical protein DVH24_016482 [Malus domestica]